MKSQNFFFLLAAGIIALLAVASMLLLAYKISCNTEELKAMNKTFELLKSEFHYSASAHEYERARAEKLQKLDEKFTATTNDKAKSSQHSP